jgi:hypothetical protein
VVLGKNDRSLITITVYMKPRAIGAANRAAFQMVDQYHKFLSVILLRYPHVPPTLMTSEKATEIRNCTHLEAKSTTTYSIPIKDTSSG